jgi:hypothetical protein
MSQKASLLTVLGGSLLLAEFIQTGWAESRVAFSFFLENDIFAFTDRYYTHGMTLSWFFPDRLSRRFGIHSLVYAAGHALYRNIFLDGNTFRESYHVDKYPSLTDVVAGIVMTFKGIKLSYAYVYRTRQFKTQSERYIFGGLNFSFVY